MDIKIGAIYKRKAQAHKSRYINISMNAFPEYVIPTAIVKSQADNLLHMVYYDDVGNGKRRFMYSHELKTLYYLFEGFVE